MRALLCLLIVACAGPTQYQPKVSAPGGLTLAYDGGFQMWSQGKIIAGAYGWSGLAHFTRCVPKAAKIAQQAERSGALALGFSIAGGILGGITVAAIPASIVMRHDPTATIAILLSGVGTAALGAVFAGLGRGHKNAANGQAIDAMNFYNDAVGSYGASCDLPE